MNSEVLAMLQKSIYCGEEATNQHAFSWEMSRLDRHLLITKRFFCCWTTAVLAVLVASAGLMLLAPSLATANDGTSSGPSNTLAIPSLAPAPTVAAAPNRAQKKRSGKRRIRSPFVQLAQRLDTGVPLCAEPAATDTEEFTISGNACLSQEPGLRWAFAPLPWQESKRWADLVAVDVNQHLLLQPLNIAFTPFSPWLPADFALFGEEERLLTSLEMISNEAEQVIASPAMPMDRHEPPFAYHLGLNRQSALVAGVGWIDDVSDTTGMTPAYVRGEGNEPSGTVGAVNFILGASIDAFTLTGGYLHALDRQNEVDGIDAGGASDPAAWNSELAYRTRLLDRKATLAVGYQKASDGYSRYFPEERYTTRASILLFDATTLSLEYYQDREMNSKNALDGDDTYGITTKFGFDF